ncbi:VTT domain-containing protein [Robertmurraya korlensis]|uniref:DedA family protein n=1 Tax=Robertmurraya korlensis TaxID=519977 RepID=UPI0020417E30|nr:VTT domain-containing protein [Robertmurraya korlensis]MCM3601769.1 VTT domain-containing protein [Robertmurraya korlensis]
MKDLLLTLIDNWGIGGILFSLFIEGSAFPFIGTFFIVTVGFILNLSWFEITWISLVGSFLYALGSYIPYSIGYKLGNSVENRLNMAQKEKLEKVKASLNKYGVWSIAVLSPLHLGNVIPFLAGVSNMKVLPYTLLTMLGIGPSTFLLLSIGRFYDGDAKTMINMISEYQTMLLVGLGVMTIGYVSWKILKQRSQKRKMEVVDR